MKKYRNAFPRSAFFIYVLIVASSLAAIVFAILRLAEVGSYVSVYPALDVVSIVVFTLFIALIGFNLFGSYFAFGEEEFVVSQLFFKKRIARDSLTQVILDEESLVAALYYSDPAKPDALSYLTVNLKKSYVDAFIEDVRVFRSDVAVNVIPVKKDGDK